MAFRKYLSGSKVVDTDGNYVCCKVLLVTSGKTGRMSVTPTLVQSSMKVQLPTAGSAQLSIFNTSGQLDKTLLAGGDDITVDVSKLKVVLIT